MLRPDHLGLMSEAEKIRMSDISTKLGIKPRTVTQFDDAPPLILKARAAMSESAEIVLASLPPEGRGQLLEILQQLTRVQEMGVD
ncbi:hypothetical protein [Paenibacillus eucommiae]|uniref:Transcriptional regulator n=1 Tax=Paenibacillus eucommiae TaxID=1355755 RepID=A0ABS4IMP6_9BACL|nr:hypothetical protein [Paenibacillus eucommiae]MBP1988775.1 hypothetical protein [Paenibacillus eucommiae]